MWILVILGGVMIVAAVGLHFVTEAKGASPDSAFLGALLGTGTVLLLAGAFLPRVAKITGPGFSLELFQQAQAAVQDAAEQRGITLTREQQQSTAAVVAAEAGALRTQAKAGRDLRRAQAAAGLEPAALDRLRAGKPTPDTLQTLADRVLDRLGG